MGRGASRYESDGRQVRGRSVRNSEGLAEMIGKYTREESSSSEIGGEE